MTVTSRSCLIAPAVSDAVLDALRTAGGDVRLPLLATAASVAAAALTQWVTGIPLIPLPQAHVLATAAAALATLLLYLALGVVLFQRLRLPAALERVRLLWRGARPHALSIERALPAAISLAVAETVLIVSSIWKRAVGAIAGFGADPTVADVDRAVHGIDPWRLLQPWLGHPAITVFIDRVYASWLPLLLPTIAWFCWYPKRTERRRFLLAFTFVWVGLAMTLPQALPSAGPCYYSLVAGDAGRFGELTAYLQTVDASNGLTALALQRWLWSLQVSGRFVPGASIAAMPSLHVAFPVLCTLAAWGRSRHLAGAFGAFAVITLLGSVHLGWHYAIDGEAAILGTVACWWVAGKLVR